MFCTNCGAENPENSNFCQKCGTNFENKNNQNNIQYSDNQNNYDSYDDYDDDYYDDDDYGYAKSIIFKVILVIIIILAIIGASFSAYFLLKPNYKKIALKDITILIDALQNNNVEEYNSIMSKDTSKLNLNNKNSFYYQSVRPIIEKNIKPLIKSMKIQDDVITVNGDTVFCKVNLTIKPENFEKISKNKFSCDLDISGTLADPEDSSDKIGAKEGIVLVNAGFRYIIPNFELIPKIYFVKEGRKWKIDLYSIIKTYPSYPETLSDYQREELAEGLEDLEGYPDSYFCDTTEPARVRTFEANFRTLIGMITAYEAENNGYEYVESDSDASKCAKELKDKPFTGTSYKIYPDKLVAILPAEAFSGDKDYILTYIIDTSDIIGKGGPEYASFQ